jgi:hypothetical protein
MSVNTMLYINILRMTFVASIKLALIACVKGLFLIKQLLKTVIALDRLIC